MLETPKAARPFTQADLSYESIQRASSNPVLDHVKGALMKMFCISCKDYNILFSCDTSVVLVFNRKPLGSVLMA